MIKDIAVKIVSQNGAISAASARAKNDDLCHLKESAFGPATDKNSASESRRFQAILFIKRLTVNDV